MILYHDTDLSSPYGLRLKDYLIVYPALYKNIVLSENSRWAHNIRSVNCKKIRRAVNNVLVRFDIV